MNSPNKPDAVNPAIASRFDSRNHWRGVTDPDRSAEMEDYETQQSDGLIILVLRVRDPDRLDQILDRLADIGADRVTSNVFQTNIADWDDGLWDQEVEWFRDLLEHTRDSAIIWHFTSDSFVRFVIGAGS